MLFDRWLSSQEVTTFQSLRDLIILEDFKNGLPQTVATHVSEHQNLTPARAALFADEYVLIHKRVPSNSKLSQNVSSHPNVSKVSKESVPVSARSPDWRSSVSNATVPTCAYCKKRGHVLAECYSLKRKNKAASQPASYRSEVGLCVSNLPVSRDDTNLDNHSFAPFIMDGFVSLPGESSERLKIPVKILRDTGASQSFILQDVLPLGDKTFTGDSILVRGFEMGYVNVPLHEISLRSDLVTGNVTVGVRPSLPIENVAVILGNDLCGGKVLPCPIVSHAFPKTCTDDLSINFPEVFSSSVVTRAMARNEKENGIEDQFDLSDTFIARRSLSSDSDLLLNSVSLSFPADVPNLSMSREQLIKEQKIDPSLSSLFSEAMSEEDIEHSPHGYFLRDGVLMRKWRPLMASAQDEWRVLLQIVVPVSFRDKVLSLAHDYHFAGHLGVNKTTDRILRHFFWPGIKKDVVRYCRVCQVTGKPNQVIPPAPLQPIPVTSEPFEYIILDCVGPLPRTKSGNQWLLTIMCSLTRFPEAIPLRKITAPIIIKALMVFFSFFGLPKTIQTDRGTNFMSRVFAQARGPPCYIQPISSADSRCTREVPSNFEKYAQVFLPRVSA